MKTAGMLPLFALALCCIPDTDALQGYCGDSLVPRNICTMEYIPHCGSDGVTYGNRCLFCNAFLLSHQTLRLRYLREC